MTKKIEHLTTELQEFFSQKDAKKLETHIQKLSEMKEDFTVPKPLKQQLKKRLEHIHSIERASKNTSFSWFSYVGIFSSLCLVFSVVFALFDTRTLDTSKVSELPMGAQVQDMSSEQTQMGGQAENINLREIPSQTQESSLPKSILPPLPEKVTSPAAKNVSTPKDSPVQKRLSSQNDALSVQYTSTPSPDITVPVSPAQEETPLEKTTLLRSSLEQTASDPISSELDVLPQAEGINQRMIAPSPIIEDKSMDMQYSEPYLSGSNTETICQDYGAIQKENEKICIFPNAQECPIDLLDACFFIGNTGEVK